MDHDEAVEKQTPKHHIRLELCTTRPAYRNGRKLTAVKVYTVHQESQYLLVQNVPAVGAKEQLAKLFSQYGTLADVHPLDDFPSEKFTEVYLVKYKRIQSARFAKKKLDNYSFFGGSLHVSYAPEYESVKETREKLQDRRKVIAAKMRKLESESEPGTANSKASRSSAGLEMDGQQLPSSHTMKALPAPPPPQHPPPPPPPPPPPSQYPPPPLPPIRNPGLPQPGMASVRPPPPPNVPLHPSSHPYRNPPLPPPSSFSVPPPPLPSSVESAPSNIVDNSRAFSDQWPEDLTAFALPPPPLSLPGVTFDASQHRTPHFTRKDYGYAWVPSANAPFPPGYDPRLPQETEGVSEQNIGQHADTLLQSDRRIQERNAQFVASASTSNTSSTAVNTESRNADAGKTVSIYKPSKGTAEKVVVKQYKPKGAPPRFVPRQLKEKPSETVSAKKTAEDETNREIRREAFRLGGDQGPELPSDPEERKELLGQRPLVDPQVEASVVTSVKAIRKRLSQVITQAVPKKIKRTTTEEGVSPTENGQNPETVKPPS